MSNICACVRVHVHQTHGSPGCHLASSCRKTDTFKLGIEEKNVCLFLVFVGGFFVVFFFDLLFLIKDVCNSEIKKQVCGF